jgi:hypothetical protein
VHVNARHKLVCFIQGTFSRIIYLQSVQRRVGEAIFYEAGQTPDLAPDYFVVQLFTLGCLPRWLD